MDDIVRYIKIVGGCSGNEGLVVGLANGQVSNENMNSICISMCLGLIS